MRYPAEHFVHYAGSISMIVLFLAFVAREIRGRRK